MAGNSNLHMSRAGKQDEFYTPLPLITSELYHYQEHFRGKVIFCNCDDPYESNFFKYFALNFNELGLKKLITTCYSGSSVAGKEMGLFEDQGKEYSITGKSAYKVVMSELEDVTGDGCENLDDVKEIIRHRIRYLKGDGDFRSEESINLLKEADIIVSNPPFSLFREYIAQLIEYNKKFVIIGNQNAVTYKEIFPLIRDNKVWLGYNNGHFWFKVPETYENKRTDFKIDETGQKWRRMGNICWFTNLDIQKRHEDMTLFRNYNPIDYPKYDNYDAIEVSRTADIPCDYYEAIGVPITFLSKYNPDQFEFLGIDKEFTADGGRFKINSGGEQVFIRSSRDSQEKIMKILAEDYGLSEADITKRSGIMGVPITFMQYYNPEQFELVGKIDSGEINEYNIANPVVNGKSGYKRIAIRRKEGN